MTFNTPTKPHKGGVLKQVKGTKKSKYLKNRYSSGVGSLLYLVNNPQP